MPQAIPMIVMAVGTGLTALNQYQQGQNQQKVADWNADLQVQNAKDARAKSEQDAMERLKQAETLKGKQRLAYAAAGVDISSGTPLDTMMQTARDAEMDAINIRKQGELTARNYYSDSEILRYQGKTGAQAATIGAGATILQGAGNAYGSYQKNRIPTGYAT